MLGIVRVPKDGRIRLGRYGVQPGQSFVVSVDDGGRVTLTPATVVPTVTIPADIDPLQEDG